MSCEQLFFDIFIPECHVGELPNVNEQKLMVGQSFTFYTFRD